MKSALLKLLALLLVVGLTAPVVGAWAARPRAANPISRREIRDYLKTSVLPVLRQQRQKLEPQLAPADQALLATYRTQLKALSQRARALRPAGHPAGPARPQPADSAATVRTRQLPSPELQIRAERRVIMHQVAALAQKYQANITRLAEEIQPQRTQWATDIKAILAKDATAEQQAKMARFSGMAGRFGGLRQLLKASMFLLMDPAATGPLPSVATATSLYPNPVAATSQLQYEVKEAGPVTVELLDKTGNTLRTVVAGSREQGTYQEALALSDLPSGTYYYKVTTRTGTETKRFVKE